MVNHGNFGWGSSQCTRKANSDPDENGRPTACGVHSATKRAARQEKLREKWAADRIRGILNADIAAVGRVLELVERRKLSVTGWGAAKATLGAILKELRDA